MLNLPEASLGALADYEMMQRAEGLPFSQSACMPTWEPVSLVHDAILGVGGSRVRHHDSGYSAASGYEGDGWFAVVRSYTGEWDVTVAATDEAMVSRLLAMMDVLAGDGPTMESDVVSMSVWSEHPMGGGIQRYGSMKVGPWGDVSANYPAATRESLERLAVGLPRKADGGLIVLCGLAGTGKTRAIEALAHAWAREARLGVVVDSDRLLSSASYLADVLTSAGSDTRSVIVAEDVDELIAVGPKSHETSKLLNVADGLVGRLAGAGTLFVLTANLPRSEIAPYVTRPGRAAAVIEFEKFDTEAAGVWLAERGSDFVPPESGMTLAQMYAALST